MKLNESQRQMAEEKMPFVYWFIANKKQPSWLSWDELVSEYAEAVCIAIHRYQPEKGKRTLEGYVFRAMIFRRSDLYKNALAIKRGGGNRIESLDLIKEQKGNYPDEICVFDNAHFYFEELEVVQKAMKQLKKREMHIVKARINGESFANMGKRYVIKKERIRQIYNQAQNKLRKIVLQACA